MEETITFTQINDFIFCPASIYFHGLYDGVEALLYKATPQLKGAQAHHAIDRVTTHSRDVISGMTVYSEQYNLLGKIDKYYTNTRSLVEYKRKIERVYDGYIFQLYAQFFGMEESGFSVKSLFLCDITSSKKYSVALPEQDNSLLDKFESTIYAMRSFSLEEFIPKNIEKCCNCIYSNICSRSLL